MDAWRKQSCGSFMFGLGRIQIPSLASLFDSVIWIE